MTSEQIRIESLITSTINYALQQNRLPIIQELVIRNDTEKPLTNAVLEIRTDPEIVFDFKQHLEMIAPETSFALNDIKLLANGSYLAGLTERVSAIMHISLIADGEQVANESQEIIALAFDEWHGSAYYPELLSAFVTPNHPEVTKINYRASELLAQWCGDPSLSAYQTKNPNHVLMQAAAVYGAMQEQNIVYSVPPASFETVGQRVRLCDAVIGQKMGTCLDLTLFYASCLEAAGLHPLLILIKGHIFAGVWLEEMSFSESVQDDPALITKRLADGVSEIAIVECTALASGKNIDFEAAMSIAASNLTDSLALDYIIDISRARLSGIRPLPQRVQTETGFKIESKISGKITDAPTALGRTIEVREGETPQVGGKLAQWERKLLDLSLRNTLINMRISQSVIPILSVSLSELEDALSDGSEYGIGYRPAEIELKGEDERNFERIADLGGFQSLIHWEFKNKRLRSTLSEGELKASVTRLYRSAKTSLEENGANTLYLALGLLRWYETSKSQKARYAPIVLIPVDIVRKSANKGYVIRLRDDEPQMNITLLEMLKQDFGIGISGLDPLPEDEHGIDIRSVFTILRRAVMDQKRWDVVEAGLIGIFSFSQFVMWNDIRNRSEDLKKNKIVQSLIDGKLSWQPKPMENSDSIEGDVLLPIPADSSQLYAIDAAAKGESFVLHGPPGTGKSQTITAIIANSLAQDKTVLFVAEKMAALTVVQTRLEALGLAPFCLELHSNKSKKRDILEQLRKTTEITKLQSSQAYMNKASQTAKLRLELDEYSKALHMRRKSGLTLYEMISLYEEYKSAPNNLCLDVDYACKVDSNALAEQETLVEQIISAAELVGHPHKHPLRYIGGAVYSQSLRMELPVKLSKYEKALTMLEEACSQLSQTLGLHVPEKLSDIVQLRDISMELGKWKSIPRSWAEYDDLALHMSKIKELAEHMNTAKDLRARLEIHWNESFLTQDGQSLKAQWEQASAKWFLPRILSHSSITKRLVQHAKSDIQKETLPETFALLIDYRAELTAGQGLLKEYADDLEMYLCGNEGDWAQITQVIGSANQSEKRLEELAGTSELRKSWAADSSIFPLLDAMDKAFGEFEHSRNEFYALLDIIPFDDGAGWIESQKSMLQDISNNTNGIREWMMWKSICSEASKGGLTPFITAYEKGMEHKCAMASYKRASYTALITDVIDGEHVLNTFSGSMFDKKVEQFKKLDEELENLARMEIYCRLAAKVPNFTNEAANSSEVGILQRAIRSGGRGVSIRKLFSQIPNLLPRLCPCMLMSPISAAQYLDPNREPFDIVVFDEASQMQTSKAVGALARGKSAVIVGDPKQMPPTSFFVGNTIDESNIESEDLESILDDCLALNMPQTHLLWHYRSRHESLIAFSNNQFYDNKLYTFPSVNDRDSKVSLVHVEGHFDRGKTRQNRKEAEAIIKELIRRCKNKDLSDKSIGIVTFNIPQQNLIDDLLTEACKDDEGLEAWLYSGKEPLFIKNLENVQGDERDVILFSIGYGPDNEGNIHMNFGPLNREGGWRRLNVAVSRAREEMLVFSAMTSEQINLSRTSAEGVAALKAFLEYAEGNRLHTSDKVTQSIFEAKQHMGIVNTICCALEAKGYSTQRMVGHSKCKIDIGVIDPKNPVQYLLGIMLDGVVYGSAKSTRDREVGQLSVLRGLGWKIHRMWSADWWDNSEKEIERIMSVLSQAKEGSATNEMEKREARVLTQDDLPQRLASAYKVKEPIKRSTVTYKTAVLTGKKLSPDEYLLPENASTIERAINMVLRSEAPIFESTLTRRIIQSFGIARAGSRLQGRTADILRKMNIQYTTEQGQKVYWLESQNPHTYEGFRATGDGNNKRDFKDIPNPELLNAIRTVLKNQIGLPREELIRETAKLLGYSRMGNIVVSSLTDGISEAKKNGVVTENADGYVTMA